MVQRYLAGISVLERKKLEEEVSDYLLFRDEVGSFLSTHFSEVCTQKCYQNKLSACCSREGIITFFGEVVINALVSQEKDIKELLFVLKKPNDGFKCVYLGENGCMWKVKPIVCEMFLCEQAKKDVFGLNPDAWQIWEGIEKRKKLYTWPDRTVLFDILEKYFLNAGYLSPLMYMHNSPGLLRVKRRAQVSF